MKKMSLAVAAIVLFSVSAMAQDRHQSYISYDNGQTVVRQNDGREVQARVNLPVFPGDEVETGRRGRSEIRLADGNIVALDRQTAVRFQSVLDSIEGDAEQTTTELLFGNAMIHAVRGETLIRVDTSNATYVSRSRSLYSIGTLPDGDDDVAVFSGSVEVRTPNGTERIRAGERVTLDRRGIYGEASTASAGNSDFEQWYIRRAERYGRSSRYLDSRISYADSDLDGYGSWVYVGDYDSWVWRPYVSVGWRPYYYGHWGYSRWGSMVWISNEPWGFVPYHYGRWAYTPVYGWVWLPGAAYSHAWVYWAWGHNYIGWIPAGWYDCYRPYYSWAYQPYSGFGGIRPGFGFHGRVQLANIDYRAWTFVDPNTLVSNRADRAALTIDAVRDRLARGGSTATVSNSFPKLSRDELKDPGAAIGVIARRGAGSGTGKDGSGSLADLTPFFRRDPELPTAVRDRIARPVDTGGKKLDSDSAAAGSARTGTISRGRTIGPIETGARDSGGVVSRRPDRADTPSDNDSGRIVTRRRPSQDSSESGSAPQAEPQDSTRQRIVPRTTPRSEGSEPADSSWRGRSIRREAPESAPKTQEDAPAPTRSDWRSRGASGGTVDRSRSGDDDAERAPAAAPRRGSGSDIPRRVIDRIGGARVEPSDRPSRSGDSNRSGGSVPRVERPSRGSDGGQSRSSSPSPRSGGGSGTVSRPSSPPPKSAPSEPSKSGGGERSNIKPNKD